MWQRRVCRSVSRMPVRQQATIAIRDESKAGVARRVTVAARLAAKRRTRPVRWHWRLRNLSLNETRAVIYFKRCAFDIA